MEGRQFKSKVHTFQTNHRETNLSLQSVTDQEANPTGFHNEPGNEANNHSNAKLFNRTKPFWGPEIAEFFQNVSVSGLAYVADRSAPAVRRVWWIILIGFGIAVMIYQIYIQVALYYSYPVRVNIEDHFPTTMKFPAVTVCSANRFSRSKIRSYGRGLESAIDEAYPPFVDPQKFQRSSSSLSFNSSAISSNWRETYENISSSARSSIIYCLFQGYQPCQDGWISSRENETERCFTFNSDGQLEQLIDSSYGGLALLLYTNQSDDVTLYDYTSGFRIGLHDPGTAPKTSQGINVSPGSTLFVKIEKEEVNLLPSPYGQCGERILKHYATYTQTNCFIECLSLKIMNRCGCKLMELPGPAEAAACSPAQEVECAIPTSFTFDNNSAQDCDCPVECKVIYYKETTSLGPFGNVFVDYMIHSYLTGLNTTEKEFRDSGSVVMIHYPKLSYKSITSYAAYSSNSLFCDMGGALGLLLGSTFFTLYEFIDFFIWAFYKRQVERS